jgi:hypothetical protein
MIQLEKPPIDELSRPVDRGMLTALACGGAGEATWGPSDLCNNGRPDGRSVQCYEEREAIELYNGIASS